MDNLIDARTWPVKQAKLILKRIEGYSPDRPVVFATGYGPSGTPHLGTAMELIRTCMVARVLRKLQDRKVMVLASADNMDGLRKVPTNVQNNEILHNYIGFPLFRVPDPWGQFKSFAEYNMNKLKELSEILGCKCHDYVPTRDNPFSLQDILNIKVNDDDENIFFINASDMYVSGSYDAILLRVLDKHKAICDVILPTLGEERQKTYSPFMPISQKTGKVIEDGVKEYHSERESIVYAENGDITEIKVTGGNCKAQWKMEMAMKWMEMKVDFEMSGKDIDIGTIPISKKFCDVLGETYPITMMYEMFLAEDGTKISKSKGNGVSLEDFLRYTNPSVIRHFMFVNPGSAKRVDIKKMPAYIDAYIKDLEKFLENRDIENPIWYSEKNATQAPNLTASMALNLIQSLQIQDLDVLLAFFKKRITNFNAMDESIIKSMYHFYHEKYSPPSFEKVPAWAISYLKDFLNHISEDGFAMQTCLYDLGKRAIDEGHLVELKDWFKILYMVLFGQESGPRLGTFFAIYGQDNAKKMIEDRLR